MNKYNDHGLSTRYGDLNAKVSVTLLVKDEFHIMKLEILT